MAVDVCGTLVYHVSDGIPGVMENVTCDRRNTSSDTRNVPSRMRVALHHHHIVAAAAAAATLRA